MRFHPCSQNAHTCSRRKTNLPTILDYMKRDINKACRTWNEVEATSRQDYEEKFHGKGDIGNVSLTIRILISWAEGAKNVYVVRKPRNRDLYKNLPIFIVKFKLKLFHKSYVNYPNLHRYSKVEKAFSHLPGLELEVTVTFKVEPVVHGTKSLQSCLTLCTPMDWGPSGSSPWDSSGKNTGEGCHALTQGVFLTQESNPHFLCVLC